MYIKSILYSNVNWSIPVSHSQNRESAWISCWQITIDLIALTLLLYFSGISNNPFIFYFIFHIIIAAMYHGETLIKSARENPLLIFRYLDKSQKSVILIKNIKKKFLGLYSKNIKKQVFKLISIEDRDNSSGYGCS